MILPGNTLLDAPSIEGHWRWVMPVVLRYVFGLLLPLLAFHQSADTPRFHPASHMRFDYVSAS